jgi:hypothetical protein
VDLMPRKNRHSLIADPSSRGPGPMDRGWSYPTGRAMCILKKVWGRPRRPEARLERTSWGWGRVPGHTPGGV